MCITGSIAIALFAIAYSLYQIGKIERDYRKRRARLLNPFRHYADAYEIETREHLRQKFYEAEMRDRYEMD